MFYATELDNFVACSITSCTTPKRVYPSSLMTFVTQVAQDAAAVYFVHAGDLVSCTKPACTNPRTIVTLASSVFVASLAVDATYVYVLDQETVPSSLYRVKKSGGALNALFVASTPNSNNVAIPQQLGVDATTAYWTDPGSDRVLACPLTGCTAPTVVATNQPYATALVVDATSVYWSNYGSPGGVMRKVK
jgi:hypothetical protein